MFTSALYTIIITGSLFGNGSQVDTGTQFLTPEACRLVAARMTQATGLQHTCASNKPEHSSK